MIIDCDRCTLRGPACASCAVTFISSDLVGGGPASPRGPGGPGSRISHHTTGRPVAADPAAAAPAAAAPLAAAPVVEGQAAAGPVADGAVLGEGAELDAAELRAIAALANAGMIPPLRYAPAMAKASLRGVVGYRYLTRGLSVSLTGVAESSGLAESVELSSSGSIL